MNTLAHTTHPMLPVAGRRAVVRAVGRLVDHATAIPVTFEPQASKAACPRSAMRAPASAGATSARTAKQAAIWSKAVSHPGPGGSA